MNQKKLLAEANRTRRLLMLTILFLLLLIGAGLFFWQTLLSNLKVEKTVLHLVRRQYQSVEKAKESRHDIEKIERLVDSSLPKRKQIVDFVQAVERILAKADNVNFNFKSQTPLAKEFLYLPFSLSFRTSSVGFQDFWRQFQKLPYFTKVEELEIKTLGGWEGNYEVVITAWLYVSEPFE